MASKKKLTLNWSLFYFKKSIWWHSSNHHLEDVQKYQKNHYCREFIFTIPCHIRRWLRLTTFQGINFTVQQILILAWWQNIAGLCQKIFISVQLIVFLDHVLLLAELAQKFKLLQNSCMAKWFHETELQGIYLY